MCLSIVPLLVPTILQLALLVSLAGTTTPPKIVPLEADGRLVLYLALPTPSAPGGFSHHRLVYSESVVENRGFRYLAEPGEHLSPQKDIKIIPLPDNMDHLIKSIGEREGHRYWLLCTSNNDQHLYLCNWVERHTRLVLRYTYGRQVLLAEIVLGRDRNELIGRMYRQVYVKDGTLRYGEKGDYGLQGMGFLTPEHLGELGKDTRPTDIWAHTGPEGAMMSRLAEEGQPFLYLLYDSLDRQQLHAYEDGFLHPVHLIDGQTRYEVNGKSKLIDYSKLPDYIRKVALVKNSFSAGAGRDLGREGASGTAADILWFPLRNITVRVGTRNVRSTNMTSPSCALRVIHLDETLQREEEFVKYSQGAYYRYNYSRRGQEERQVPLNIGELEAVAQAAKNIQGNHVYVMHADEGGRGEFKNWSTPRVIFVRNTHALDLVFNNQHEVPFFTDLYVHTGGDEKGLQPVREVGIRKLLYGGDETDNGERGRFLEMDTPAWLNEMIREDRQNKKINLRQLFLYTDLGAADDNKHWTAWVPINSEYWQMQVVVIASTYRVQNQDDPIYELRLRYNPAAVDPQHAEHDAQQPDQPALTYPVRFDENGYLGADIGTWIVLPLSFIPTQAFQFPFKYKVEVRSREVDALGWKATVAVSKPVVLAKKEANAKKVLHARHNLIRGWELTYPMRVIVEDGKQASLEYAVSSESVQPLHEDAMDVDAMGEGSAQNHELQICYDISFHSLPSWFPIVKSIPKPGKYGIMVLTKDHRSSSFIPSMLDDYYELVDSWRLFAKKIGERYVIYAQCSPHDTREYPVGSGSGARRQWCKLTGSSHILTVLPLNAQSGLPANCDIVKSSIPQWMLDGKKDYRIFSSPSVQTSMRSFCEAFDHVDCN